MKKPILAALLFALVGCSEGKNVIFVLDTSKSMNKNDLISEVKNSMRRIAIDLKPGDAWLLYTFDSDVRLTAQGTLKAQEDIKDFFSHVDGITPSGNWTNLIGAVDSSLQSVSNSIKENPGRHNTIIFYTDGKDDPPPELRGKKDTRNFEELIRKYYASYVPGESWFIYTVDLGDVDPGMKNFLEKTGSGTIVSGALFREKINFMLQNREVWPFTVFPLIGLICFFFLRPWLHSSEFVTRDGRGSVSVAQSRRNLIFSRLGLSAYGPRLAPAGIGDADIGVNMFGQLYIRPNADDKNVLVNGTKVEGRKVIRIGHVVRLGDIDLVVTPRRKAA